MLRNPEGTESVFDIEDGLRNLEPTGMVLSHVLQSVGVADRRILRFHWNLCRTRAERRS